ncbi:developmental pluripotency-associated protein 2-like [Tamandua tetradactyla]|uniref:developmental pluripotency-associated protein 2-like n=1 Tax=Tamandua tetradactyla TaxID=48850 RepID=UPI0040543294
MEARLRESAQVLFLLLAVLLLEDNRLPHGYCEKEVSSISQVAGVNRVPGNAYSNCDSTEKNVFEEELEEEHVKLTLVPLKEEPREEHQIDQVQQDTLQKCGQHFNLSSDGLKIEVYPRFQQHALSKNGIDIPDTPRRAKLQSCSKSCKTRTKIATGQKSRKRREREEMTKRIEVTASDQKAILASWTRITVREVQLNTVNSCSMTTYVETPLLQASGVRWYVIHGRFSLQTRGIGFTYSSTQGRPGYLTTPKRMRSLFLLPACTFASADVEDNILCPECGRGSRS